MELPIKIIITIVVALVVAIMMLGFSERIFNISSEKFESIGAEDLDIFFLPSLSATEASYLATECLKNGMESGVDVCFIAVANSGSPCSGLSGAWSAQGQDASKISVPSTSGNVAYYYFNSPDSVLVECN